MNNTKTSWKRYDCIAAVLCLCLVRPNGKSTATDKAFFECTVMEHRNFFFLTPTVCTKRLKESRNVIVIEGNASW